MKSSKKLKVESLNFYKRYEGYTKFSVTVMVLKNSGMLNIKPFQTKILALVGKYDPDTANQPIFWLALGFPENLSTVFYLSQ